MKIGHIKSCDTWPKLYLRVKYVALNAYIKKGE